MIEETVRQRPRGWLRSAVAFVRSAEPREPVPARAVRADAIVAALVLAAALAMIDLTYHRLQVGAALVVAVPLAARRRFPLAAFAVLVIGVLATRGYATSLSFLVLVVAGYSAAMRSRFRGAALLVVALAGVAVAYFFWRGQPAIEVPYRAVKVPGPDGIQVVPSPGNGFFNPESAPYRMDGLLALTALVAIAIIGGAAHAGERIRRLQAEHEAATRQALEDERARIASELHDVVTHNVSVMIVQAGAARQVLDAAPGEARAALLAVESSGRAAMAELRHLLGLLSPAQSAADAADPSAADAAAAEHDLRPQPGLSQLPGLVGRMRTAGLPVDLHLGEPIPDLPPGVDLAAFRVVQEALTNVIKHAGKPATSVSVGYREGCLLLEITDSGRAMPAVGPVAATGCGRGLLGLRERVGVYGGELDAGPQPGGGWRVRARIPVEAPALAPVDAPALAPVDAPGPAPVDEAGPAPVDARAPAAGP